MSFFRSGHWPSLLAAFLYFDTSFMVWLLMGALGAHIAADLELSPGAKALTVALPILGGALARIPLGILGDRLGPKRAGIVAQALVALPLLGMWLWASSWMQTLGMALLFGVAGGSFAIALPLASRSYPPEHQGLAMGIAGAGNSGTVLAALLAPRLAEGLGWKAVFGLALIPVGLTLLAFCLLARECRCEPRPAAEYLSVLRQADTGWFCAFYTFTFGGFVGLASFLVIFFHDQYGVSKVAAGTMAAACVLAGSLLRPVGGFLADRFGGAAMLHFIFLAASALLMILSHLPPIYVSAALLVALLAILGLGNGAVFQIVPRRFPREIGGVTGIVGAAGGIGGFLLPVSLGVLKARTGSYGAGFLAFGLFGLGTLAVLMLLHRRWQSTWLASEAAVR